MKFTDGYWMTRPGVSLLRPVGVDEVVAGDGSLTVYAATAKLTKRGDTLNRPLVTITLDSPAEGVLGVTVEHFRGALDRGPHFELTGAGHPVAKVEAPQGGPATLTTGNLTATVAAEGGWSLDIAVDGRRVTGSDARGLALVDDNGTAYVREQLDLGVREHVYGLGERFTAFVKNSQTVDVWNADGGTSSEQAYKNVPFLLSDKGYGVFVDHPEHVSFEIGSEAVSRTQFSVPGQRLRYYVIAGPDPKDVLRRYTALTGRPAAVPDWSYGLWLSTSFTTSYDEDTVLSFIDGMAERGLPLSVFHFDCFWMRQFHWSDFVWDPATFPDPEGLLRRLHERDLKVCVWINPYIAQRSYLFDEGRELGYLVTNPDGSVWQWDLWQAGMGLVDFTNPDAVAWFQGKLRALLDMGVDCFKTDFGERIPTDVVWHDGSDPQAMHNYYTHLYNKAVFDLLVAERGEGEAVLFARSATAGGQQFPVHWGGDCESTFVSMAESLRGGLSLSMSGFGYWSHDIGGFEGTPDPAVFKRWLAFGLLSSHSRLHGSDSYRVPWAFDQEAVEVTRRFTELKLSLMPYLSRVGRTAHTEGLPVMRPMVLEFPADPAAATVDTQYMLGENLLVAPVFSADGEVDVYVPEGTWTSLIDGSTVTGPRWHRQQHDFLSVPLLARPDSVLPVGARTDRPDYDHADGVTLRVFEPADGHDSTTRVGEVSFRVTRSGDTVTAVATGAIAPWSLQLGDQVVSAEGDRATITL
ncbi:alpha-xylosidase [Cellulomonas denverensis]|uniref:alpha-D-xyloside xylohydrolase n=1 Tax=Cellulomonas denverensis TaxID=264297 RepID=A0A7X6R0E5_9CELL|nr:alpha-xylosidase [Cellulomonas denverensis]NKY24082.1 alpha-xylosidase [Cellulomonas denverensis]GIG26507.1 alpha-xylosidase [Cellulomonas denverensis]